MRLIVGFLFVLLAFYYCYAASIGILNCYNLDADQCKTKFSELFRKGLAVEARDFAVTGLDDITKLAKDEIEKLKPEETAKKKELEAAITKTNDLRQKFVNAEDDSVQIYNIMKTSRDKLVDKQSLNSKDLMLKMIKHARDMENNLLTLWTKLYVGLRPSDLEKFPQYRNVNNKVEDYKSIFNDNYHVEYANPFVDIKEFLHINDFPF